VCHTGNLKAAIYSLTLALACAPGVSAQEGPLLPGGASSLTETYGDWHVACQVREAVICCAMSQQQLRQDGQRIVTVELKNAPDDTLAANFVLPFGLQLDAGATLRMDEQPAMAPLRFHTCLPAGCVVQANFDSATVTTLHGGTKLHVTTKTADTEQDFAIAISLNGFTAAFDRLKALTAS